MVTFKDPSRKPVVTEGKNILLSDHCVTYLNSRIKEEEESSRLYLSMSMWLNNNGYAGASSLWKKYSDEENTHANWSRIYLLSMGVQPITPELSLPKQVFAGLPEIISMSYQHEIVVTKQCKELATQAFSKGDHMLYQLALHYLNEQVEEHNKMQNWTDEITAFGTEQVALRLLDEKMSN